LADSLLIAALVLYVITAATVFYNVNQREFRRSLQADTYWSLYWNKKSVDVRRALIDSASEACAANKKLLGRKAQVIRFAVAAAGMEVVLVGLALISSRLVEG